VKKKQNYYRRITESLPQASDLAPHIVGYLTVYMAVMALLLTAYLFFLSLKFFEVSERKLQAKDNLSYWESVVKVHPNFTDGYYNAGFYSFVLGDKAKALEYLDEALSLDPGFEKARELEELIRR
jgi:tetratricopeptide (TPR) repeat protein